MRVRLTKAGCTLYRQAGDSALRSENAVTHAMKTLLAEQGREAVRPRGPQGLTGCKQLLRLADGSTLWHEKYQIEQAHKAFNDGSVFYQRVKG